MRGKDSDKNGGRRKLRITPAHAGKSNFWHRPKILQKDHPRTCGEKVALKANEVYAKGSPPHMRGKGDATGCCMDATGITPAHAGKSLEHFREPAFERDHPRTCGEKCAALEESINEKGSPPHMRGKAFRARPLCRMSRITPAHAGKSPSSPTESGVLQDHPRACGEKRCASATASSTRGSPPRMRGKANSIYALRDNPGITPAHAGKRVGVWKVMPHVGDHPRACGEKD